VQRNEHGLVPGIVLNESLRPNLFEARWQQTAPVYALIRSFDGDILHRPTHERNGVRVKIVNRFGAEVLWKRQINAVTGMPYSVDRFE
jgi:hypothetical protein